MIKTFIEEYYNETNEQNNEQIILALNNYIVSKLIFNEILEKGDGNCFYRTLADRVKDDHMRIREKILNYMLEMFADFQNNSQRLQKENLKLEHENREILNKKNQEIQKLKRIL